jgi:KDO2-lipid IV(A) lauroyltransferase
VGRRLGSLLFTLDRRHREITLENVRLAYAEAKTPAERWDIARGAFRHFGAMLFELLTLGSPTSSDCEALVEMEGVEHYERARARGKGVILVAAHFGNWELHAIAHGYRFGPMHVVAREQDNRRLDLWLERLRGVSGNEVVYKKNALRRMRKLMKRGETVALVIDQNVHLDDAVFVDFFGRKAATTPVASWFAIKTGAALVPAFCCPLPNGRYRAVYEEPIYGDAYHDMPRDEALTALTARLVSSQESYIRENPDMWLWMHRRWRTRPRSVSVPVKEPVGVSEGSMSG